MYLIKTSDKCIVSDKITSLHMQEAPELSAQRLCAQQPYYAKKLAFNSKHVCEIQ